MISPLPAAGSQNKTLISCPARPEPLAQHRGTAQAGSAAPASGQVGPGGSLGLGGVTPKGTSSGGPGGPHTKGCPQLSPAGLSAQVPAVGSGVPPPGCPPQPQTCASGGKSPSAGAAQGGAGPRVPSMQPCLLPGGLGGTGCRRGVLVGWGLWSWELPPAGGEGWGGAEEQHWAVTQFPRELCGDGWAGPHPGVPQCRPPARQAPAPWLWGVWWELGTAQGLPWPGSLPLSPPDPPPGRPSAPSHDVLPAGAGEVPGHRRGQDPAGAVG